LGDEQIGGEAPDLLGDPFHVEQKPVRHYVGSCRWETGNSFFLSCTIF
jgi:hypothetical protein